MKTDQAIEYFLNYQKVNSGEKTVRNYRYFLNQFKHRFGDQEIAAVTGDDILTFISENTEGQKQATKRFKHTTLKTYFNFLRNPTIADGGLPTCSSAAGSQYLANSYFGLNI